MKYPKYPSPCLKCEKEERCRRNGGHLCCNDWRKWWLWWWNYFRENLGKDEPKNRNKLCYEHPDISRKELTKNPCNSCFRKEFCTRPCYKYLAWYDARMQIARKKVQL